jgi:hypothetical protein
LYYEGDYQEKVSMTRITISLRDQEKIALRELAEKEFRDPRAQAALIIRQELERRGYLQADHPSVNALPTEDLKKKQEGTHVTA